MRKYLALLVLPVGLALSTGCAPSEQPESPLSVPSTTQPQQGITEPSTGTTVQKLGITLAQFNSLTTGMTYEQVVSIVGFPGELQSEFNYGDHVAKSYTFEGSEDYSNAIINFSNNALDGKSQFGLK